MDLNLVDSYVIALFPEVPEGKYSLQHLRNHGSPCSAQDAVFLADQGNEQRIQRDVQQRARGHNAHCDLQLTLAAHHHIGGLGKVHKQGADVDNLQVFFRLGQDFALCAGEGKQSGCKDFTHRGNYHGQQYDQCDQVAHDLVHRSLVFPTHSPGQDRSRSGTDQRSHTAVQQGEGIGNLDRRHGLRAYHPAHKNRVHEIVQADDHHAQDRRDAQRQHGSEDVPVQQVRPCVLFTVHTLILPFVLC